MLIRNMIAALGFATLAACGSGAPPPLSERLDERQAAVAALESARLRAAELRSQYRAMAQEEGDENAGELESMRQLIADLQAAIAVLQTLVDDLAERIAALGGDEAPPPATAAAGDHAPVVTVERDSFFFGKEDYSHVGADAASGARVAGAGRHRGADIFYGAVTDGVSKETLVAYLRADAAAYTTGLNPEGFLRRFGREPPVVAVVEGATRRMVAETREAVRIVNAALPPQWQIGFAYRPQPGVLKPENGTILVEFALRSQWPGTHRSTVVGLARTWLEAVTNPDFDPATATPADFPKAQIATISSGRIWVDHTRVYGVERIKTLVHELIHALGRAHADPVAFPATVMDARGSGLAGHVLHPLDRDALLAVYGRLDPHTLPAEIADELGPWETTGLQIRGRVRSFEDVEFGVTLRNGVAEPWAFGKAPFNDLEYNVLLRPLFGPATWTGRLVGFTPQVEAVGGQAVLTVDMSDLDGELSFTSLEKWLPNGAPGAVGTGEQWGDGDLRYTIAVTGNTFRKGLIYVTRQPEANSLNPTVNYF